MGKQAEKMALQVQQSKRDLLAALEETLGVVTTACLKVGLDRTTFYNYVKSDLVFAAAVKEIDNVAIDFAENSLHLQIKAGVPASTIFYLKTKAKHRGYVERQELVSPIDAETERLRQVIQRRAAETGRSFEQELTLVMEFFGDEVHPGVRQLLTSDLTQ